LIFQETIHDNPLQHVRVMPAGCRWHYIVYLLSDLFRSKSFSLPNSSVYYLMGENWQAESCHSLPLVHAGCSKTLSLVWKLCGLTEAQCAVFHTVLALWIWSSYMIWQSCFTPKDCVCVEGMSVTLYPVCHDWGSPILFVLCLIILFVFHLLYWAVLF